MWQTKHLKFTDEAAAIAALSEAYPSEEGYQSASHTHAIDSNNIMVVDTPEVLDEAGEVVSEATYIDGFHVNLALNGVEVPESLVDFLVDVNSPSREFSGL